MTFTRITVRADQMGGVPCIRGLRIPVATVVGMIAEGVPADETLDAYPDIELADVQEARAYSTIRFQEPLRFTCLLNERDGERNPTPLHPHLPHRST